MAYTEASKKATIKYQKEHLEQYLIRFTKGDRSKYSDHADMMGETLASFIKRALAETMARDRTRIRETMKNQPKPAPEPTDDP